MFENRYINLDMVNMYEQHLYEQEKSAATIKKYIHDITVTVEQLSGVELTKSALIEWKENLCKKYAAASVNTILASLNSFLAFKGWSDLKVKPLKIQKSMFRDESKELTRKEYERLVRTAKDKGFERLSLLIETLCSLGLRVSELKFITVEGVQSGQVEVNNKGKRRMVHLPQDLRKILSKYIKKHEISAGPVFITKNGKPLDRSNIWRDMKKLCESANVDPGKVFPHNLRHLFARMFYSLDKDLAHLADILGHSNVNTTRIYTRESNVFYAQKMERLRLVIT